MNTVHQKRWGLIGIGKLGRAILRQLGNYRETMYVLHPSEEKLSTLCSEFSFCYPLSESEINTLDFLILTLPAGQIVPFIEQNKENLSNTVLINMATSIPTKDLISKYPSLSFLGMKYMGHSNDLYHHGNGLFITEPPADYPFSQEVISFFRQLGEVCLDHEETVEKINKLATYYAIKACKELESALHQERYSNSYERRALTSLAPEVMRSYALGTLGHFAQKIAQSFSSEKK